RGRTAGRPARAHRGRDADQQFPALADRLRGTLLHRHLVAGHGRGGVRCDARGLRRARAPFRQDQRASAPRARREPMKQRLLTILVLAPIAVALVLLLPNPGFAVLCAIVGLVVLWEITRLLGLRSPVVRGLPLLVAAALMALVWWSRSEAVWWMLIGIGIAWWLAVLAWLRHFSFGAAPTAANRLLKLGAGLLTVLPAWAALVHLHGD